MKIAKPKPGEPIRLVLTKSGEPRYRVVLDAGTHANGKRRQVRSTHRTLSEARSHVQAHRTDRDRGILVIPDRQSFEEYAIRWMDRRSRQVRPRTALAYRAALDHAITAFGSKRLGKVDRSDVEHVVAELFDQGRAQTTITKLLFILRSIFADAIDEGLILRNPASRVEAVGREARTRDPLRSVDIRKLRGHLTNDRLYACWLLTLYGLRRSEVLGLRWSDIDFANGTLKIERGRVEIDGKLWTEGPPKTRRGKRTLSLPSDVLTALRKLRRSQLEAFGAEQVRTGYLAVTETGEPMRHERWSDLWREHCKASGVPVVTLHAARHSSVTAMREAGVPDHDVAAWHGHDEAIMRRVYSHSRAEGLAAAGKALSEMYGGAS